MILFVGTLSSPGSCKLQILFFMICRYNQRNLSFAWDQDAKKFISIKEGFFSSVSSCTSTVPGKFTCRIRIVNKSFSKISFSETSTACLSAAKLKTAVKVWRLRETVTLHNNSFGFASSRVSWRFLENVLATQAFLSASEEQWRKSPRDQQIG